MPVLMTSVQCEALAKLLRSRNLSQEAARLVLKVLQNIDWPTVADYEQT